MAKKQITQFDERTGEVLTGFVVYVAPRRTNGFQRGFFMVGQHDALDVMEKFNRLEDFRVLVALLKRLDYENVIVAVQKDIARALGMDQAQVSRAIGRLVAVGAILKGPRVGNNGSYRLNPNFGWKGSAEGHVKALEQYRQKRLQAAGIEGVLEGGKEEGDRVSELVAETSQPVRPLRKNRFFKSGSR